MSATHNDEATPERREIDLIRELPDDEPLRLLHDDIRQLLEANRATLHYHGWPHTRFVTKNAMELARQHDIDYKFVGSTALVHDLNYLVRSNSEPMVGAGLIAERMKIAGYTNGWIARTLETIEEANLSTRGPDISPPAACLSDADTLFKALPFTPLLLASAYLAENRVTLRELAKKIVAEQGSRLDQGYYFYFEEIKVKYSEWARQNVEMWKRIADALADDELLWLSEQLYALNKGAWDV